MVSPTVARHRDTVAEVLRVDGRERLSKDEPPHPCQSWEHQTTVVSTGECVRQKPLQLQWHLMSLPHSLFSDKQKDRFHLLTKKPRAKVTQSDFCLQSQQLLFFLITLNFVVLLKCT